MHKLLGSKTTYLEFNSQTGIIVGLIIIFLWFVSLIGFLRIDTTTIFPPWIIVGVLLRSFLHTGLFITIHEAIHGTVSQNRQVNNGIGYITSFLYALLPYKLLAKNHQLHHLYPATKKDPDFHFANSNNFLFWYFSFMKEYQKGKQAWVLLIGMTVIYWTFVGLHISPSNIFLFWVIPILISSLQLFTFGIFLPHRQQEQGNLHRARSNNYSAFWSFIACYHFGYHWEHHQYPNLPWYKLPLARQETINSRE